MIFFQWPRRKRRLNQIQLIQNNAVLWDADSQTKMASGPGYSGPPSRREHDRWSQIEEREERAGKSNVRGGRNCARPSVRASKQFFACFAQFVKFKFAKLDDTEPSRHQRRRLCASKGAGRKRTRRSAAETTAQIRTLAVGVAYEISRPRVLRPVNAHLARLAIWPGRFLAWLRRLACTACT